MVSHEFHPVCRKLLHARKPTCKQLLSLGIQNIKSEGDSQLGAFLCDVISLILDLITHYFEINYNIRYPELYISCLLLKVHLR